MEYPAFFRAEGTCKCPVCGRLYEEHPFDKRFPIPQEMWVSATRPEYVLHKLCNGDLVKL